MDEVIIVGVDLAKQVFQLHGAASDGRVIFRKKLSRAQFARFIAALPPASLQWRPVERCIIGDGKWQLTAMTSACFRLFM